MTNSTNVWRVTYQRPVEYEVANCQNIFAPENEALISIGKQQNARRFVVVDANVEKYFSAEIRYYFEYYKVMPGF